MEVTLKRSLSTPKIPDVYTKKRRITTEENNPFEKDNIDLPSDTMIALKVLRQHYENISNQDIPPLIFKTQIYSHVTSRTEVDRELNDLQQKGKIRLFKIIGKTDLFSVLLMEDYLKVIAKAKAVFEKEKLNTAVFDRFVNNVIPNCKEIMISKQTLNQLIGALAQKNLFLLIRSGLIVVRNDSSYWFNVPGTGGIYRACESARKDIVLMLKHQKFKEALEQDILKKKLRYSKKLDLGIMYHIKDLIGENVLCRKFTTSGTLLHFHPSFEES